MVFSKFIKLNCKVFLFVRFGRSFEDKDIQYKALEKTIHITLLVVNYFAHLRIILLHDAIDFSYLSARIQPYGSLSHFFFFLILVFIISLQIQFLRFHFVSSLSKTKINKLDAF